MSKTIFVSTSIPYVNGRPHIGHALEFVQADALSRYYRRQGCDVFFLTGTDGRGGERFRTYWQGEGRRIHVIGKGINRFHTIYWPAMLLSTGLPLPETVFVHGYLTVNGQKISKSLGIVVDPLAQIEKYGSAAVRYYLLRGVSPFEDGDYAEPRVRALYNADLANNLGNLIRRIETLGHKAGYVLPGDDGAPTVPDGLHGAFQEFRLHDAAAALWSLTTALNQEIDRVKPWDLQKQGRQQELTDFLDRAVRQVRQFAFWLEPFLPQTAHTITARFHGGKPLQQGEPLFPRLA